MKVLGLVVEYNPFHNGHIQHIQKSKEIVHPDVTIAVMSSSFVQRGEPAIINKWKRSQLALEYGIDIVIELPFVYTVQSADYFCQGAIDLLHEIGVSDICFGSESGDIQQFEEIAYAIKNNEQDYNTLIKQAMKEGLRYPNACNKALNTLLKKEIKTPNDLLGLSYVKEIIFNDYPIKAHCIKRTSDYHSDKLTTMSSASAIRKAIKNHQDYSFALPHSELYSKDIYTLDDFYPYLKYTLLTTSKAQLRNIHMVDEGIENVLSKNAQHCDSMNEFIESLLSKRYTRPRIQRMIVHILMHDTKEEIKDAMKVDYLRILGMNEKGRDYLNKIKKNLNYHLVTNYSKYQHPALDIELKATRLLSLICDESIVEQEFNTIPYKKMA